MKKFIIGISLFLLPVCVCAVILEVLLRQIPNDYSYKRHYLDTHANEIEILVLGSSHTYSGIDPVYFSGNMFNTAYSAQALGFDYEILKRYDEKLIHLQAVILPVSYFTLWRNLVADKESWRNKNYVIYYGIIPPNTPIKYYFELSSNNFSMNIKRLKSPVEIKCSQFGWATAYNSKYAQDLEETGKNTALLHLTENIHSLENEKLLRTNIMRLDSIASICRRHNAKLFLLTPPAYKTYRQHLNREQSDMMISTATEFAKRNSNCTYINLLEDSTFVSTDYFDADHLSEIGAKKLSLLIAGYLAKDSEN